MREPRSQGIYRRTGLGIWTEGQVEFMPDGEHAVPIESGETMGRRPRRNHHLASKRIHAAEPGVGKGHHLDLIGPRGMAPDQAYFTPLPFRSAA
jgi:hypothetical protein